MTISTRLPYVYISELAVVGTYNFLVKFELADLPRILKLYRVPRTVLVFFDSLRLRSALLSFLNLFSPFLLRIGSSLT